MTKLNKRAKEKITKEMVEERVNHICHSLYTANDFTLTLNIKQTANWPKDKRRQLFRAVFQIFLKTKTWGNNSYTIYLRKKNIDYWYYPISIAQLYFLKKFLDEVISLEKNGRFMPEKVLTLNSMPLSLLMIESEVLTYLIDRDIIRFGKSFKITASSKNPVETIFYEVVRGIDSTIARNTLEEISKHGINLNILFTKDKFFLKTLYNIGKNIDIISDYIVKEGEVSERRHVLQSFAISLLTFSKDLETFNGKLNTYNADSYFETLKKTSANLGIEIDTEALPEKIFENNKKKIISDFGKLIRKLYELLDTEEELTLTTGFDPGKEFLIAPLKQ